jgi:hypothetical protein
MTTGGHTSSGDAAADPLGRLVEVFVFAPLGLAVTIVHGQRVALEQVGRLAVRAGRASCAVATEGVRRVRDEVGEQVRADRERSELARLTSSRGDSRGHRGRRRSAPPDRAHEHDPEGRSGDDNDDTAHDCGIDADSDSGIDPAGSAAADGAVASDLLAIDLALPDYDHLPASQIVSMLGDLISDERDDIEQYERANRGRRTVLGKLDQLRQAE